jgi:hypothetical protein
MQSSVKLKVSSGLSILSDLNTSLDLESEDQLLQVINEHADQIAYMLQVYHPREKVSRVEATPESIDLKNRDIITLKIQYILEEFSACAAIDTLQLEKMTITILVDQLAGELELKGEYWPERDSD